MLRNIKVNAQSKEPMAIESPLKQSTHPNKTFGSRTEKRNNFSCWNCTVRLVSSNSLGPWLCSSPTIHHSLVACKLPLDGYKTNNGAIRSEAFLCMAEKHMRVPRHRVRTTNSVQSIQLLPLNYSTGKWCNCSYFCTLYHKTTATIGIQKSVTLNTSTSTHAATIYNTLIATIE